jgi:hypothetical protein
MVRSVAFLPDERFISDLAKLHSPVTVSRVAKQSGAPSHLMLSALDAATVLVQLLSRTVVFKFEVFELTHEPSINPSLGWDVVGQLAGWTTISCLFRFEWLRPALPSELPSHYEQIVGERGRREKVPENATALTVSIIRFLSSLSAMTMTLLRSE